MKNINASKIFCFVLLIFGCAVNPVLMTSMIISFFVAILLSIFMTEDNIKEDVMNIQSILEDENITKKANEMLITCSCLFATLTIVLYKIFTKS